MRADVVELADALDLGSSGRLCRFKSCHPPQKSSIFFELFCFALAKHTLCHGAMATASTQIKCKRLFAFVLSSSAPKLLQMAVFCSFHSLCLWQMNLHAADACFANEFARFAIPSRCSLQILSSAPKRVQFFLNSFVLLLQNALRAVVRWRLRQRKSNASACLLLSCLHPQYGKGRGDL